MTVLTRTPDNTNLLQPTKFLVMFDRIPETQYFCQRVNIPGANMPEAPISSPFHNYTIAGLNIKYNLLEIEFLVDEEIKSWRNIYEWFLAISSPVSFEQRNYYKQKQNPTPTDFPSYSDLSLTALSGLNNSLFRLKFINAFPVSLSDISFDTTQSADNIITATATFNYEYFEFETV